MTEGRIVSVNGNWDLWLPEHRANRAEWTSPAGWEKERLASMAANIGPGDVVYDVGTEEGDLSALFAMWTRPRIIRGDEYVTRDGTGAEVPGSRRVMPDRIEGEGGGVVLIEPNPRVWSNIKTIWQGNDLPAPLACHVGFAGPEDRGSEAWDAEFVDPRDEDGWPVYADGPLIADHGFLNLSERPDVPVVKIDTLASRVAPPTAITVDVEGAELAVMRGAEQTLRTHRPLVWISVHPEFGFHMYGVYESDLHGFMHSCGYVKRWLGFDHEHHWLYTPQEHVPVQSPRQEWT